MLQLKILGNEKFSLAWRNFAHPDPLGRSAAGQGDFEFGQEAHPRRPGNCCLRLGVNIKFWRDESVHVGTKPHVPEKNICR